MDEADRAQCEREKTVKDGLPLGGGYRMALYDNCVGPAPTPGPTKSPTFADPDDNECNKYKLSADKCREKNCGYVEDLGICERECNRSTKEGSCRLRSCEWDGPKNVCVRDCRKQTVSKSCKERGCRWSESTGKFNSLPNC